MSTLAQMVKAKYPGVYDDMDDADLEQRVRAKYPGAYDDLPLTGAKTGARPIPPGAKPGMGQKVGDFLTGAAKGYGETMAQTMSPLALGPVGMAAKYAMGGGGTPEVLRPTEAERPGYLAEGVAESLVPGARLAKSAVAGAPGMVRRAVNAIRTPVGAGLAAAGTTYAAGADPGNALLTGAAVGLGLRKPSAAVQAIGRLAGTKTTKAARPALKKVAEKATQSAAKAVERAAPAVEKAAPVVAKAASRGAAVASKHNTLMQFAKKIAQSNPKVGEKIWILLDDAGKPLKMLTPDQAGAAVRKGQQTTWVKNLWSR